MENNSDKQLRDKLNSTEFPFDPQAWGQMEALLDNKKKRRGFFWWWTGGIAAALLLGVVGYEVGERVGSRQLAVSKGNNYELRITNYEKNTPAVGSGSKQSNTSEQFAKGNREEIVKSEEQSATNASRQLTIDSKQERAKGKRQIANARTKNRKQGTRNNARTSHTVLAGSLFQEPALAHNNAGSSQSRKNLRKHSLKQNEKSAASSVAILSEQNPFKKEIEMLNEASAKNSAEENISLTRREASLLEYVSENAIVSFDKKEEDVLPKQKKKIFNYSLGVAANVTCTTLGRQEWNTNRIILPKPSYMVGLTSDFLFTQRVAVTTSVLFSQTSFIVSKPKTTLPDNRMIYYTSKITELDIPIGIKIYPVVKNTFRFYINTGIINHIKLKETFTYTISNDTIANNALVDLGDATTIPAETNFSGNYAPSTLHAQGVTGDNSTKDFSINSAKRYYASFYAGAGFEYVAKKHFIVFAEPMYYMSLQKIGVQEKRKYNFGITGGFRYQF